MLRFAVVLLFCSQLSCRNRRDPQYEALATIVYETVELEWRAAGFKKIRASCRAEDFEIRIAVSLAHLQAECASGSDPTHQTVNGCLKLKLRTGRVRSIWYPVAIAAPEPYLASDRLPALAAHELLHLFFHCSNLSPEPPMTDPSATWWDAKHSRKDIWEHGGPTSVEARVDCHLYGLCE